MVKTMFQFCIACLLFWNITALLEGSQVTRINSLGINNCRIVTANSTAEIPNGEKIFYCSSISLKYLGLHLSPLLQQSESPTINLKLNNIEFNAKENGSSKMSTGWLNVTDLLYVKCLQLRKIKIVEIEDDAFAVDTFSKLEHLNIVYVPLEILNPKSFNGLKQLRTLFLRGLNLITFQENLLSTMSSLKSFVIIECGPRIMYIDNLFGYTIMPNLNEIQIYNCILKDTITEKTFKSTPSVSSLVLVACSIEKIGPKSFDPIVNGLRFLHLGFNQLKSLPDDLFNTNHQIFINVNSNPWHCDCQIDKMRQFAQTKTNVHFNGFICVTPQEYNDVPLIGCPSLCKENTTLTTDSDLLDDIVEEMDEMDEIEEMEALTNRYQLMETGTRSENEPIDSNVKKPLPTMISSSVKITKKSIYVTCEISASEKLKKMIELTRPTRKNLPAFRTKCGELHIYTESLANNFKLIELNYIAKNNNENQSIEFEGKMFNNNKQCRSYFKDTGMKRLKIKRKLRANLFYHFCWIKKDSNTIVPLNCVAFYSGPNERGSFGGGGLDAWIMKSKMPIIIVCFILTVIFAIFIGTVEAFLLAQIFPKKIRGRMSDLKKSSSNPNSQNRGVDTLKVQETVNRPKLNEQHLRQRIEPSTLRRPANQMDSVFESIDEDDEKYGYITVIHVPQEEGSGDEISSD